MQIIHLYVGAVLVLLYTGVAFRRKRRIHVPIMLTSFILDITAVVYLEFNRAVLKKVLERASEHILQIHLTFAITTLIGYGIALYTGSRLLKGAPVRPFHRMNALIFLIARTGVFITSLFVV